MTHMDGGKAQRRRRIDMNRSATRPTITATPTTALPVDAARTREAIDLYKGLEPSEQEKHEQDDGNQSDYPAEERDFDKHQDNGNDDK
jgi:hypothetical protein